MDHRWTDLRERLERAVEQLTAEAHQCEPGARAQFRLRAKREGVRLALDYMGSYPHDGQLDEVDEQIASLIAERANDLERAAHQRAAGHLLIAQRAEDRAAQCLEDIALLRFRPGSHVQLRDDTVYGGLPKPTGRVVRLTNCGKIRVHWGLEMDDHDGKDLELIP
jgi:transposase